MDKIITLSKKQLLSKLWAENRAVRKILRGSKNPQAARDRLFDYLNGLERTYFNIYSGKKTASAHIVERNNAKECIRILKNIIRTENEKLAGFSALGLLFRLAKNEKEAISEAGEGFFCEFIFLFRGIGEKSRLPADIFVLPADESKASALRSKKLDEYAETMEKYLKRYKSGTDKKLLGQRHRLKKKILRHFGAKESDWQDYLWHLKHIIRDYSTLSSLVKLDKEEAKGIAFAEKNNILFQITPYYLSLFNEKGCIAADRSIRAQVLPSSTYGHNVFMNRRQSIDMDFMGEKSTSPVKAITRRYPQIVILKPFDSCPQICVYCQRNWEVKGISETCINEADIKKGILWLKKNTHIKEVLVTGGDPLTLDNRFIGRLIGKLSKIKHIERIRIGTRIPVTLPFRIDKGLVKILSKYHEFGKREICIVTHFQHPSEITPDSIEAVRKLRMAGISVYNQQVFTYYNSLKYETGALRKALKLAGIDPYYTFNTKGKEETVDFRVPIARIEQERKEEARFLPGIVRTDEPVFNVPKLGKSHLRAGQDHEPIMVLAGGQRVYRFYPWESKVTLTEDYLYTDVPIYDYLKRLAKDKEKLKAYSTIWYYF
ncbi:MAG: KamA family radical SAM protein [Candidatus Diapherotrites archaeon]